MLFYALPCVYVILPHRYLNDFSQLSQAIYLLLQSTVTETDTSSAQKHISKFVANIPVLYGLAVATFNTHVLKHLPKSVEMLGPLWGTSTFSFEGGNGGILKLVSAAKGVPFQIAERNIMHLTLSILRETVIHPPHLQHVWCQTDHTYRTNVPTHLLGAGKAVQNVRSTTGSFFVEYVGFLLRLLSYPSISINNAAVHSSRYKTEKRCSYYVLTGDWNVCKVEYIYGF